MSANIDYIILSSDSENETYVTALSSCESLQCNNLLISFFKNNI